MTTPSAMGREDDILQALEREGNLRSLCAWDGGRYVNFSSNDYLGIGADTALQGQFLGEFDWGRFQLGNPASRLMTGNVPEYSRLEEKLAQVLGAEAALVVGSGYAANSGVLPAVTQPGDVILADRLVHASLVDGLRLCPRGVRWERFRHNDMGHLEQLLLRAGAQEDGHTGRRVFVVTESLFSMDGDPAPLDRLAQLQREYGFRLYLDEAHAFGVYGDDNRESGAGLLAAYNARNPQQRLEAEYLVVTFGKAMAAQGAAIACSARTRELLVNRMRPLIFSTALPPITLAWVSFLVERLPEFAGRRARLWQGVEQLGRALGSGVRVASQIVPIPAGSNQRALQMAAELREQGLWTTAIRYPTVPRGQERLRVSITAAHTMEQISKLGELCRRYF